MQELRLVAVSEDGSYVILTQPGRGTRFSLPNDERLRAVARGQFSRLAQYEIEVESPLRPKEIQARIRAGETAEQIADAAGIPVDRVRWFEGPVLAERAYIAQQAQNASVRSPGDSGPGPRLGEIVTERLRAVGDDPENAEWDSIKRADGSWLVLLAPSPTGSYGSACWVFDVKRRHAIPDDDQAARLSLPEDALAEAGLTARPEAPAQRSGTVTPFVPRSAPAPEPKPDRERRPASGTHGADGAPQAPSPPLRRPASVPRSQPTPAGLPRPPEPAAEPGSPDGTPSAPERHHVPRPATGAPGHPGTAARTGAAPRTGSAPGSGPAERTGAAASDETPAAEASEHGDEAAAQGQAADGSEGQAAERQGRQAASTGRGGRRGRIRRSSVPTWDEIMFGDSRRPD